MISRMMNCQIDFRLELLLTLFAIKFSRTVRLHVLNEFCSLCKFFLAQLTLDGSIFLLFIKRCVMLTQFIQFLLIVGVFGVTKCPLEHLQIVFDAFVAESFEELIRDGFFLDKIRHFCFFALFGWQLIVGEAKSLVKNVDVVLNAILCSQNFEVVRNFIIHCDFVLQFFAARRFFLGGCEKCVLKCFVVVVECGTFDEGFGNFRHFSTFFVGAHLTQISEGFLALLAADSHTRRGSVFHFYLNALAVCVAMMIVEIVVEIVEILLNVEALRLEVIVLFDLGEAVLTQWWFRLDAACYSSTY